MYILELSIRGGNFCCKHPEESCYEKIIAQAYCSIANTMSTYSMDGIKPVHDKNQLVKD